MMRKVVPIMKVIRVHLPFMGGRFLSFPGRFFFVKPKPPHPTPNGTPVAIHPRPASAKLAHLRPGGLQVWTGPPARWHRGLAGSLSRSGRGATYDGLPGPRPQPRPARHRGRTALGDPW